MTYRSRGRSIFEVILVSVAIGKNIVIGPAIRSTPYLVICCGPRQNPQRTHRCLFFHVSKCPKACRGECRRRVGIMSCRPLHCWFCSPFPMLISHFRQSVFPRFWLALSPFFVSEITSAQKEHKRDNDRGDSRNWLIMVVNLSMQRMTCFRPGPTRLLGPYQRECMHKRICEFLKTQEYSNSIKGYEMKVLETIMEMAKDNETCLRNNTR